MDKYLEWSSSKIDKDINLQKPVSERVNLEANNNHWTRNDKREIVAKVEEKVQRKISSLLHTKCTYGYNIPWPAAIREIKRRSRHDAPISSTATNRRSRVCCVEKDKLLINAAPFNVQVRVIASNTFMSSASRKVREDTLWSLLVGRQ